MELNWEMAFRNFNRCKVFRVKLQSLPNWRFPDFALAFAHPLPLLESFTLLTNNPSQFDLLPQAIANAWCPSIRTLRLKGPGMERALASW